VAIDGRRIGGYVLAGLAGLIVGYFAGREHLKFEMRGAVQSAAQEFQKGIASAFSGGPSTAESKKPEPPAASKPREPPLLELTLTKKGFKAKNIRENDYEDDITFELSIKNLTDKDIRAFDGMLTFTDLLDNKIMASKLAINDPIHTGSTLIWKGRIEYNQFMEPHQRLRNEADNNLKIVFDTRKILFLDGTIKEFNDR
jgi:hypothetical protein